MLHILGIDEHFERHPAAVADDIVDGDVDGMIAVGPANLVGLAGQRLRALQGLRHVDDAAGFECVAVRFGLCVTARRVRL